MPEFASRIFSANLIASSEINLEEKCKGQCCSTAQQGLHEPCFGALLFLIFKHLGATYLPGSLHVMPTRSVFRGWCLCCLICARRVSQRGAYVGYIRKALEKGHLEHPRFACCTDDMFEIFVRHENYLAKNGPVSCPGTGIFTYWHIGEIDPGPRLIFKPFSCRFQKVYTYLPPPLTGRKIEKTLKKCEFAPRWQVMNVPETWNHCIWHALLTLSFYFTVIHP